MTYQVLMGSALGAALTASTIVVWPEWPWWRRSVLIVVLLMIFKVALDLAVDAITKASL